jgi:hypothetical protein
MSTKNEREEVRKLALKAKKSDSLKISASTFCTSPVVNYYNLACVYRAAKRFDEAHKVKHTKQYVFRTFHDVL